MLNEKGLKYWKGPQITNKVSNVEWKVCQMLKGSQITNKVSNVRQRVSNAEKGLKRPIRPQMLNEKGLKCWGGSQKLVKMSSLVTVKIPLWSQFLVKVSNLY